MGADYARGRLQKPHLRFRYKVRAQVATGAYLKLCDFGADQKVLDLGCADALTLLEIRKQLGGVGQYVGVELSDDLLAAAPALPPNVELVKADVTKLPASLEAGTFTLVTALALLEHLPDPQACVREAFRMLRPGGLFVATCPHPTWDHVAGLLKLVADEHHEQHLDGAGMMRMCEEAGFEKVTFRPFMFAPVGFMPYLRLPIEPKRSLEIDAQVEKTAPWASFAFANQAVVARKPRT